jgi:hypothetical protein
MRLFGQCNQVGNKPGEARSGVCGDKKRWRRIFSMRHLFCTFEPLELDYSAPTFGRHLSNRFSHRSMTSVRVIPEIAKIKTPTKTLSV